MTNSQSSSTAGRYAKFVFHFTTMASFVSCVLMVIFAMIDQYLLGNVEMSDNHQLIITIASIGLGLIAGVLFARGRHEPPPPPPRRIIMTRRNPGETADGRTIH
jgi:hypothetical protein